MTDERFKFREKLQHATCPFCNRTLLLREYLPVDDYEERTSLWTCIECDTFINITEFPITEEKPQDEKH